ncbi:hypothetical protein ACQ86N_12995 [Puia sp. P3]|uniref:SMODS-associated NUDIX domain-containing protein n=1 Tax=Puia sp. P3 TaxID=3423952 RepID=UPI003D67C209
MDPTREFNEELIVPGLLPEAAFRHLTYVFLGKHEELEIPSKALPIDEFRYADIFELRLETKEQEEAIRALAEKSDEVLFASSEEIKKVGLMTAGSSCHTALKSYRNDNITGETDTDR